MARTHSEETRKKRLAGAGMLAFALAFGAGCVLLGRPMMALAAQPESFRAWIDSHGMNAQLTYIVMVLLQVVVAVIPGEPLEIAGGYAFGAAEGTLLFFVGATVGSMIVFGLVRRFGLRAARLFFPAEKLERLQFLKKSPKRAALFFLVFMIPGTPKDLLCYFAGLTDMRPSTWLIICSVGRLPSLVTSTLGGDALGERSYLAAAAVFGAAMVISLAGLILYRMICKRNNKD